MLLDNVIPQLALLTADAVAVIETVSSGDAPRLAWVNDPFCEITMQAREDLLGRDPYDILHSPDYAADFMANLAEASAIGEKAFEFDTKCMRGDGTEFWANMKVSLVPLERGGRFSILSLRDIDLLKSREQAAELALIENEGLFRQIEAMQTRLVSAINTTPDAFAIYDAEGRLDLWNPAFARFTTDDPSRLRRGMTYVEVARLSIEEGVLETPEENEQDWLDQQDARWSSKAPADRIVSCRGLQYRVTETTTPSGDRVVHCVDISDFLRQQVELQGYAERLESANNEIRHQALHDELTGLGNRRFLNSALEEWIVRRNREGGEIAALHIDLDRFKQINDTLGHAAGDFVLSTVAEKLRARVREGDIVTRTGGDEFVLLIPCTASSDAPELLAERLIGDLSRPITIDGRPCMLGASIGVARTPVVEPDQLLTSSDIALYKAKEGGRAMMATFDIVDLERMREAKRLADDVMRALDKSEFVPVYQPQVDPLTGETVALEVLARWQHPQHGLLSPDIFLSTACEMKVDGEIDRIIFQGAIAECNEILGRLPDPPALSFNLGMQRLMGDDLLTDVERYAYRGNLAFELLETIFLEDETAEFADRIASLRKMNMSIEVDDFGSGRASIVGLRRISPERLKIDRRLVEPVAVSESSRKLVEAIIDIGKALGIGITAEGVETKDQADLLRDLGCDRLQGFLFSYPVPLAQVPGLQLPRHDPKVANV